MNSAGNKAPVGYHQVLEVSTTEAMLEIHFLKSMCTKRKGIDIHDIVLLSLYVHNKLTFTIDKS